MVSSRLCKLIVYRFPGGYANYLISGKVVLNNENKEIILRYHLI